MTLKACLLFASLVFQAEAATASTALEDIKKFAEELCGSELQSPLNSSSTSIEIGGKIDAKLAHLIGRLGELGVSGAATLKSEKSSGVLQKDLASERSNSRSCRYQVFERLVGRTDIFQSNEISFSHVFSLELPTSYSDSPGYAAEWSKLPPEWKVRPRSKDERCQASRADFNGLQLCLVTNDGQLASLRITSGTDAPLAVEASQVSVVELRTYSCSQLKVQGMEGSFQQGTCTRLSPGKQNGCIPSLAKVQVTARCKVLK